MISALLNSTIFVLFVIIALGFIVGRINIKGIALDVSAVIFVALLFGHYGVVVPDSLGTFGMAIFIFAIGIQAGPGFFSTFKSKGKTLSIIASILVIAAALTALGAKYLFGLSAADTAGLLAGALTSTPGLAAAREMVGDDAAIAYGVAYPVGVLGVILFIKFLPKVLKIDIRDEERKLENKQKSLYPDIVARTFRVNNPLVIGRKLSDISLRLQTGGAIISRILRGNESIVPAADTTLENDDLIKIVGTPTSLEKAKDIVGESVEGELPFGENVELQTGLVTQKSVVNRTLGSLNLQRNFGCTVTRVRRSGIDLTPSPSLTLKFGDKLTLVGRKDSMNEVLQLIGNEGKRISDTDFFPIALGIALGVLVGHISISFGSSFVFSFGLTGGILLTALILSTAGKTGPIIWTMSSPANQLLRQLGLLLFLANVGTSAGEKLVETFLNNGWMLFIGGFMITLLPMIAATAAARIFYKINLLELMGTLAGGMTSTPGLAAADSMSDNNSIGVAYATVYPVAMVLLIICIQTIAMIVG